MKSVLKGEKVEPVLDYVKEIINKRLKFLKPFIFLKDSGKVALFKGKIKFYVLKWSKLGIVFYCPLIGM
jgi:hypothetical protein